MIRPQPLGAIYVTLALTVRNALSRHDPDVHDRSFCFLLERIHDDPRVPHRENGQRASQTHACSCPDLVHLARCSLFPALWSSSISRVTERALHSTPHQQLAPCCASREGSSHTARSSQQPASPHSERPGAVHRCEGVFRAQGGRAPRARRPQNTRSSRAHRDVPSPRRSGVRLARRRVRCWRRPRKEHAAAELMLCVSCAFSRAQEGSRGRPSVCAAWRGQPASIAASSPTGRRSRTRHDQR